MKPLPITHCIDPATGKLVLDPTFSQPPPTDEDVYRYAKQVGFAGTLEELKAAMTSRSAFSQPQGPGRDWSGSVCPHGVPHRYPCDKCEGEDFSQPQPESEVKPCATKTQNLVQKTSDLPITSDSLSSDTEVLESGTKNSNVANPGAPHVPPVAVAPKTLDEVCGQPEGTFTKMREAGMLTEEASLMTGIDAVAPTDPRFVLFDTDLPPIRRTQANYWKALWLNQQLELIKLNKGIRRLKAKIERLTQTKPQNEL